MLSSLVPKRIDSAGSPDRLNGAVAVTMCQAGTVTLLITYDAR